MVCSGLRVVANLLILYVARYGLAVAARLHCHPKTLRRRLLELMASHPGLCVRKLGRSIRFTERDFGILIEALKWRSASADVAKSTTHGVTVRIEKEVIHVP